MHAVGREHDAMEIALCGARYPMSTGTVSIMLVTKKKPLHPVVSCRENRSRINRFMRVNFALYVHAPCQTMRTIMLDPVEVVFIFDVETIAKSKSHYHNVIITAVPGNAFFHCHFAAGTAGSDS